MFGHMATLASRLQMGKHTQSLTIYGLQKRCRVSREFGDLSLLSAFPGLRRLSLHQCSFRFSKALSDDIVMHTLTLLSIDCCDAGSSETLVMEITQRCPRLQHVSLTVWDDESQSHQRPVINLPSLGLTLEYVEYGIAGSMLRSFLAESAYRPKVLSIALDDYIDTEDTSAFAAHFAGDGLSAFFTSPVLSGATKLRLVASGNPELFDAFAALAARLRQASNLQVEVSI